MPASATEKQFEDFIEQAYSRTWSERNELLKAMEDQYAQVSRGSQQAVLLGFALAKVSDDLGDTERCFSYLEEANWHHRRGKTDNLADARSTVARVREIFSAQPVQPLEMADSLKPIFIVGMPRSGTSLVEQILASHSKVYGGGELKAMGQWCFGFVKLFTDYHPRVALNDYLPQLQEHYLQQIRQLTDNQIVTDKMPVNFLWLGFILSAFPDAIIVHTEREPMAVCWSLYKTAFAGTSNGYACDLRDIGEFYRLYNELMKFWKERHGTQIYDLNYEQLTTSQEEETRRLLTHCGIEWEPACLEFYNNPREVQTVSRNQVKLPMYQGSSRAWERYERHLDPLKKILEPILS
jgi:hypothetical protein